MFIKVKFVGSAAALVSHKYSILPVHCSLSVYIFVQMISSSNYQDSLRYVKHGNTYKNANKIYLFDRLETRRAVV